MGHLRLKTLRKSRTKGKKWDAVFEVRNGKERVVPFGAVGYSDYTKHKDVTRRARYIKRHTGRGERWGKPDTPGALSRWILWGPSTSVSNNAKSFKKKFHV